MYKGTKYSTYMFLFAVEENWRNSKYQIRTDLEYVTSVHFNNNNLKKGYSYGLESYENKLHTSKNHTSLRQAMLKDDNKNGTDNEQSRSQ